MGTEGGVDTKVGTDLELMVDTSGYESGDGFGVDGGYEWNDQQGSGRQSEHGKHDHDC